MQGPVCPVPLSHRERVVLGHGSGGKMMFDLIKNTFQPAFSNPILLAGDDAAIVETSQEGRLAISVDAHVVSPHFFPGGDIGKLAVCGTVNDVSMMGAIPLYLTAGFILEEGLEMALLQKVIESMQAAASEAGIKIIAGDTKVVEKGAADGLYITTTGVGLLLPGVKVSGSHAKAGDQILLSGPIGDHGIAVLEARGELGFQADVQSDIAPLNHLVAEMFKVSNNIHVLRDPTRGGLATTLNEIARQSQVGMLLDETAIPVRPPVQAACELLGFDPLYIANEGKLIAIVGAEDRDKVLDVMRANLYGKDAVVIGQVLENHPGKVLIKTAIGTTRVVEKLMGELLPRIC